ncbi:hypothetical protein [Hymenobacter terricola]|uniref:hypothetical protein n=1 Tax=Hymenobacter terricola TaxID=2819236 RepID=UPI001B30FF41|nr:hypothetical protein [Hymenobacter terricola]
MANSTPIPPATPIPPRTLDPIEQGPAGELAGYLNLYYLPVEDLVLDPVVVNGAVLGDLALRAGAIWVELKLTQQTLKVAEVAKTGRHGTTYQVKVTAQRPQPTPGVLGGLDVLDRRRLLLMARQADGQLRLLGTRQAWLQLLVGTEGAGAASHAGLDVQLLGDTPERGPYYKGLFLVATAAGTGNLTAPVPGTGVRVLDRLGNLMAIVPGGHDLIISSGFRVALTIN